MAFRSVEVYLLGGSAMTVHGRWLVISAPDRAVIKGLKRLTPKNYAGFARGVKWNTSPQPSVGTYPYDGVDPGTVRIDPDEVLTNEILNEGDEEKVAIPLDTTVNGSTTSQSSLSDQESIPWLIDAFTDLESQPGIGDERSHAGNKQSGPQTASVRHAYRYSHL